MYTYQDLFSLMALIDSNIEAIEKKCQDENKKHDELIKELDDTQKRVEIASKARDQLCDSKFARTDDATIERKIDDRWRTIVHSKDIKAYINSAKDLSFIYSTTRDRVDVLRRELSESEKTISMIKAHKDYKTWVTNADKLRFGELDDSMPYDLSGFTPKAIQTLISYSTKVLWAPYKRYMYYHLYIVYKKEVRLNAYRQQLIDKFTDVNNFVVNNIPVWIKAINQEINENNAHIEDLKNTINSFESDSNERITQYSDSLVESMEDQFASEDYNKWFSNIESSSISISSVNKKSDLLIEPKEDFVLFYEYGNGKKNITHNDHTMAFANNVVAKYYSFLFLNNNIVHFKYPELLHLDSLRYRMCINAFGVNDYSRSLINGIAQNMVGSVIANIPVGKVKLVFGDPANTGVFSTFRDVGKNESEGSRLSTYIVDVDSINKELERLSNEIAYTINNILKGTKTTLYQHNKERAFNSSPYVFLFLMDYPLNMTSQSLQALKNIVENGPKCGIFTIIFNMAGSNLQLLRPEEQAMATEIALSSYSLVNNRAVLNKDGLWIAPQEEIPTSIIDSFTKYYNDEIKDSQQLTVSIDELEGEVCHNGDFKIPIGKNLGGETEYMSFFGSCQDYLMSGATRIGKTNALHVIIYNTIKYVPNAELYLVDFKQGVEFAPYARLNTPVIKALAVESVPEFGYAVLKHIEDKIKAIGELFISNSVKNWKEYFEKTGRVIPVTIVVLDEFQHLFDTDSGKDCSRIIELIAKEGGAFNVHIILSTQSMSSVQGLTETAKINIFGRMAFYHSESEYAAMLWGDSHLALTLNGEVKGQMVFATGDKNSQRLLQWALAKPVNDVVDEFSKPIEMGRYPTKLLLSTIRDNPFSVFNAVINGNYHIVDPDVCELTIGNEVNVFSGELRKQIEAEKPQLLSRSYEDSYLKLKKTSNDNLLVVGNNESMAEAIFQLSIYCALAKQISLGRKKTIVVLSPDMASRIVDICEAFGDYIDYYSQEDDLNSIDIQSAEYLFVFGLQNFRSLSYQPDSQMIAARNEATQQRLANAIRPMQNSFNRISDGQILQSAIESSTTNVIAWHNSMQNLTAMFGGAAKIQDFTYRFMHKIAFRLSDKNEAISFTNSETCLGLSNSAAVYVKMNSERIIRPYKTMDTDYCELLNSSLRMMEEDNNV